uniref:R3H domain-containing protein n=2 Tax=Arion vulgaris TaxID=1028688 RepID=A0A0B6YUA7_9EUPU
MGLINGNENDPLYGQYIENCNNRNAENNHTSTDEEDSDVQSVNSNRQVRSRPRTARQHVSVSQENLAYSRWKGVRRSRRLDNLKYLINLQEKDDDLVLNDPSSTFEPSSSIFEELFENADKMEMWNSFVESSEEEQRKILNYRGLHDIKEDSEEDVNTEGTVTTAEDNWVMILDERSDHPAFSPKECYSRVDRNLRALLKRRQLPMGILANLEREIVTFFHDCPTTVYISSITSSFERMLLHALCQYLNLRSQSFDDNGSRKTQVENKHRHFRPPLLLLTEYLQLNQHSL